MPITNSDRAVVFTAGLLVGLAVGMPIGAALVWPNTDKAVPDDAATGQSVTYAEYVFMVTGLEPAEDDPAFDCRLHGNHICGPDNAQGVPPGLYRPTLPTTTLVDFVLGGAR
ncbi:hypothetical protein SEA_VINCENZO_61 [Mycobacterium phage Vincenzo]|uniref:Uncharacterized protein n=2 Tax=Coopervirus vincenzo TaxID=1983110 RepID=A0A0F6WDS6_9CAUD|nr:hypothetical protein SEA_VINCENZO_61 [Mycobacterium phage Vincenzo]AKF14323.1 hypothetical protein SEA_VINCENZO_61 [Mycobacterium phage Vincenzo]AKF14727.1 hypothetical protein SEA_ALANGRANT_62 [Mycobacterium phage AlanGrant]